MKPVYKDLRGHVVGTRHNSYGPIRAKNKRALVSRVTVRCRSAYNKPCGKAEQLNIYSKFLRFLKSFDRQSKIRFNNIYWAFRN